MVRAARDDAAVEEYVAARIDRGPCFGQNVTQEALAAGRVDGLTVIGRDGVDRSRFGACVEDLECCRWSFADQGPNADGGGGVVHVLVEQIAVEDGIARLGSEVVVPAGVSVEVIKPCDPSALVPIEDDREAAAVVDLDGAGADDRLQGPGNLPWRRGRAG